MIQIVEYSNPHHRQPVIDLWNRSFGYDTAHNTPSLAIDRKLAVDDALFFVALDQGQVIGTLMAGYDGHRGWLYALAVTRNSAGSALAEPWCAMANKPCRAAAA